MNKGHVYLLIEREFIKTGESIYKIGHTCNEQPLKRFFQYPKNSHLILLIDVENAIDIERTIKKQLKLTPGIQQRRDIGTEYFEGDVNIIKKFFSIYCFSSDKQTTGRVELENKNEELDSVMEKLLEEIICENKTNPLLITLSKQNIELYKQNRELCKQNREIVERLENIYLNKQ